MSLFISLNSESLKLKRTAALYLCLIASAFIPILLFFETLDVSPNTPKALPWNHHFLVRSEVINLIFLPLYIILTSTLLLQIEYRDKTWKQVLASPQKLINVFFAKFIMLHMLILLFLISYNMWLTVAGAGIELLRPELFNGGFNLYGLLTANGQTYFLIFGISAIQFWLALRFKNFIAPLAIGFCLWFIAPLMIFELKWTFADIYPYSYSILGALPAYKSNILNYQWCSVGNAVLFLSIGFIEFKVRKVKA